MERKHIYKNMLIDAVFPVFFWGSIYFVIAYLLFGYWTWELYSTWFITMCLMSPLNALSGRVINKWRKITGYTYKGYE